MAVILIELFFKKIFINYFETERAFFRFHVLSSAIKFSIYLYDIRHITQNKHLLQLPSGSDMIKLLAQRKFIYFLHFLSLFIPHNVSFPDSLRFQNTGKKLNIIFELGYYYWYYTIHVILFFSDFLSSFHFSAKKTKNWQLKLLTTWAIF